LINPPIDQLSIINQKDSKPNTIQSVDNFSIENTHLLKEIPSSFEAHTEDQFVDFYQEGLVIRKTSREGPAVAVGDLNGDQLEDVFIGGATGQVGQLYFQTAQGNFAKSSSKALQNEADFEDTAALLFDADSDGDLDLFVGSGGNNNLLGSRQMQDRLYINDGKGNFELSPLAFSVNGLNTAVAVTLDFDKDGNQGLFVGSRSVPSRYGVPPPSFLYQNTGDGKFKTVTKFVAPELERIGMVTDAKMVNILGDETPELVIIGEWMAPTIFESKAGKLEKATSTLSENSGWWYCIETDDIDGDGDQDLLLGNRGENFYFTGSKEAPSKLWINDFDNNGTVEKAITRSIEGRDMPLQMRKELTEQLVSLKKQNLKNSDYANKAIQDLFAPEVLKRSYVLDGTYFNSAVAINDGNGQFSMIPFPPETQFSSVNDIVCADFDNDSKKDLLLAGNDSGFLPQYSKLDASFGHVLLNSGNGTYELLPNQKSGFSVKGDVRQIVELSVNGEAHFLVLINDEKPRLFKMK